MPVDEFNALLLAWYERSGRSLPWRQTADPYAILVSEVMLQQTQVERVRARYEAWLERWPTPGELAAAPTASVIAAWSGLGYNARAVRLQRAAGEIASHGWPETVSDLEQLPGVGPYTARAIAAFAFGLDVLPVDVNVERVLLRALGRIVEPPPGQAAVLAQALFDLGATVCLARIPRCSSCPLAPGCPSRDRRFQPQRKQSRFEGSRRQRRSAIVRQLLDGSVAIRDVEAELVPGLVRDGLAVVRDGRLTLPVTDGRPSAARQMRSA